MSSREEMTEEQKLYLQGFVSGASLARSARGLPTFASTLLQSRGGGATGEPAARTTSENLPKAPEAIHHLAQDRFLAEGKKLCPEEEAKRNKHPLDVWDDIRERAAKGIYPKGTDVLATKYHGLFYVAPAQDSYMCRLRLPAGLVSAGQLRGVAEIAERFAGAYSHVTTRANLQIREILAQNSIAVVTSLQELGIVPRGSGADNIRNVTATPTAGIDTQELIDTRPLARELHYYILHHREMYGLPRKFNIAFDGGGTISALEDTNDVGFSAVRVGDGKAVPPGVYFRVFMGGITGHMDFARDTGLLLRPEECVPVAAAIVRTFIDYGDRTDRKKARLRYLLDRWGFERFLTEAEKHLPSKLRRFPLDECEPRRPVDRAAHIGFHAQRQPGLLYLGVVLPVGKMSCHQMRGLASIAERHGSATLRLTVWQNLLISDIPADRKETVKEEIEDLGLAWKATHVRSGLVACTGNFGCKFSASDTKRHAMEIADYLDARLELDVPINIHLTGCPHSCAQHYLGDIGLLGTKVAVEDDMVEGYHIFLGGGYGTDQEIGREIYRDVNADHVPGVIDRMLSGYMAHRNGPHESFREFSRRFSSEQLITLFDAQFALQG
jgi:ferredoxin-nitrite reductase